MPPENRTCEKHDKTIGRVFDEINHIKNAQTAFDVKMDQVIEFKNLVHAVIYGKEKDGLITKISKCFHMQNLQWTVIILIVVAILGFAFRAIAKVL